MKFYQFLEENLDHSESSSCITSKSRNKWMLISSIASNLLRNTPFSI